MIGSFSVKLEKERTVIAVDLYKGLVTALHQVPTLISDNLCLEIDIDEDKKKVNFTFIENKND